MPSLTIADAPAVIPLARGAGQWAATATFSVTNATAVKRTALLRVRPVGQAAADWFVVDGDAQPTFGGGETQACRVRIGIPDSAQAGSFSFQLRVINEADPNNDWTDGPATRFDVPARREPAGAAAEVFYEDRDTRIDADLAKFGSKTIPIDAISAIDVVPRRPLRWLGLPAFAAAAYCLLYGLGRGENATLVLAILLAGVGWLLWRRRRFGLVLATASGRICPLVTADQSVLTAVRTAIERALRPEARS